MIDIEIEDEAWTQALPDAEKLARGAALAACVAAGSGSMAACRPGADTSRRAESVRLFCPDPMPGRSFPAPPGCLECRNPHKFKGFPAPQTSNGRRAIRMANSSNKEAKATARSN